LFIGAAGGLLAAHLPGFSETPAVAVLMAATAVSILKLPLSATVITLLLTSKAGIATAHSSSSPSWSPTSRSNAVRSPQPSRPIKPTAGVQLAAPRPDTAPAASPADGST